MSRVIPHDEAIETILPPKVMEARSSPQYEHDAGTGLAFYATRDLLIVGMTWDGCERAHIELTRADVLRLFGEVA